MPFLFLSAASALFLYLIIRGGSMNKDWEREDEAQLQWLREQRRKQE